MPFKLTLMQRLLLFGSALSILIILYMQIYENGFEGYFWIIPLVAAVGMFGLAVSTGSDKIGKTPQKANASKVDTSHPSTLDLLEDEIKCYNLARKTCRQQILPPPIKNPNLTSSELLSDDDFKFSISELNCKSIIFSVVILWYVRFQHDKDYAGGFLYNRILGIAYDECARSWKLGRNYKNMIGWASEEDKNSFVQFFAQIPYIQTLILPKLLNNQPHHLFELYKFLFEESNHAPTHFNELYGNIVEKLTFELENRAP